MNRFYFHFSGRRRLIRDTEGRELCDLAAAHRHAMLLIQKAAVLLGGLDWRGWSIRVTDAADRTVLDVLIPQGPYFGFGRTSGRHRGAIG
jgi:hypothetical protein